MRICFGDYDRELALVVELKGPRGPEIIGVGRLNRVHGTDEADLAVLVTDEYQHRGLENELLCRAIQLAREEGIHVLSAEMMADNLAMQGITNRLGFTVKMQPGFASLRARLEL